MNLKSFSVAQKMTLASSRTTSRVEVQAYSLMGIFDINMPLLYGEGDKAFTRLQVEILKVSTDESIFAWTSEISRMFASLPFSFRHAHSVVHCSFDIARPSYAMTNKGLSFELLLEKEGPGTSLYAALNRCDRSSGHVMVLTLKPNFGQRYNVETRSSRTQSWH